MNKSREKELHLLIYEQDQIIDKAKKQKKVYVDELNKINPHKRKKYDRRYQNGKRTKFKTR